MANVGKNDPARDAVAVTPSDTGNLGNVRSLYVGGAGDVSVVTAGGTTTVFSGVPAGGYVLCEVTRVRSTDTTATNIVALY